MNTLIKVVLLDYGKIVAPEDGPPVIRSVYGTSSNDQYSYKLFGSLRKDLALGKISEDYIKQLLTEKGYTIPADYNDRWKDTLKNHMKPTAEMVKFIKRSKTNGYSVLLLSNVWPLSAEINKSKWMVQII